MIPTREPTAPRKERSMNEGLRVGERLTGYHGLITGVPEPLNPGVRDREEVTGTPNRKE